MIRYVDVVTDRPLLRHLIRKELPGRILDITRRIFGADTSCRSREYQLVGNTMRGMRLKKLQGKVYALDDRSIRVQATGHVGRSLLES